jgi:negative regulator of flagellin synthesis FlgM
VVDQQECDMKIGTPLDKPLVPSGTGKAAPKDPLGSRGTAVDGSMTSAGASATENTKVSLSSAALAASSGAPASADFDAAKVAAFQQAIQGGKFKMDPEAIADRLLSNAQELLSRTREQ